MFIRSLWGKVFSVNQEVTKGIFFEGMRANVITDCLYKINEKVLFEIEGV